MFRSTVLALFAAVALISFGASAQTPDPADLAERQALAKKIHQIKPVREQVEAVVQEISTRLPEENREQFKSKMLEVFDFDTLEKSSEDAMAEVFTAAELKRMIEYFGSDEAKTIAQKMPIYQQLVQPQITKLVDQAMMTVRTGTANPVVETPAASPNGAPAPAPEAAPKP
jgi:hypothetical protein